MAINLDDVREAISKGKKNVYNSWCNCISCVQCQNGFCICGPEVTFISYTEVKGIKKPVMYCNAYAGRE